MTFLCNVRLSTDKKPSFYRNFDAIESEGVKFKGKHLSMFSVLFFMIA